MSIGTIASPPFGTPLDSKGGFMTQQWSDWFVIALMQRLQTCPQMISHPATATGQTASYPNTSFNVSSIVQGIYRVCWTARITTAASVSSNLSVTIGYTRAGVACTQTSQSLTSNASNLPGSGIFTLNSDGGSPITYSTTLASVGTAPVYEFDAELELVAAA